MSLPCTYFIYFLQTHNKQTTTTKHTQKHKQQTNNLTNKHSPLQQQQTNKQIKTTRPCVCKVFLIVDFWETIFVVLIFIYIFISSKNCIILFADLQCGWLQMAPLAARTTTRWYVCLIWRASVWQMERWWWALATPRQQSVGGSV